MGGGIFDQSWDACAHPWLQPNPFSQRQRGPAYGAVPQDRAFQKMYEPMEKKGTVKIIPVTDGGDHVPQVPVERKAKVVTDSRFKSRDAAATKIQSVFRGYVVRKTKPLRDLRVIRKVEEELEVFKDKLQTPAQRQKLYNEPKERLRWTEGVMAMLLRLDSLQGVHPEVRLIRRALTKELIGFQEAIDGMYTEVSEEDDVIARVDNNLTKEHAEVIDFASPLGEEVEEFDSEKFRVLGQEFILGGADRANVVAPPEAPRVDVSGGTTPFREASLDEFVSVIRAIDAEVCEQATIRGREASLEPISDEFVSVIRAIDAEVYEQATKRREEEAESMVREEAGRPALDTSLSGDVRQETVSECGNQGEELINRASDSLVLESPWLQAGQPEPSTDGLSDHALLLQVLEENRKLKDVVGKVLQWGNHKDDVIQNLLSRIEHLEKRQPSPDLLHCEESDGPKETGRWSEIRNLIGIADPEDSLSSDGFSDDFLW